MSRKFEGREARSEARWNQRAIITLIAFAGFAAFVLLASNARAADHTMTQIASVISEEVVPREVVEQVTGVDSGQSLRAGHSLSNAAIRVTRDGVDPDNWGLVDVYRIAGDFREYNPGGPVRLRAQSMDCFQGARLTACTLQQ